jgi:carboxypeptidase Taq
MAKKSKPGPYEKLVELSTRIHNYGSVLSLLHWDQETYMPPGAISARSRQIAEMSHAIHEQKSSREFKRSLEELVHLSNGKPKRKGLTNLQRANVREWRKDFLKATKLPPLFVKTYSQLTSEASQIWAAAKKGNDFKLFAPFLEKIIAMNRQKADILGFAEHPYDALLEAYEPCMTTSRVGAIFDPLRVELKHLLKQIASGHPTDETFLHEKVDGDKQLELGRLAVSKLPIDPAYSRLDLSMHPFSIALHPHDSRITTRILPKAFMSNIFSVLHEAGHSMYEMGLPAQHWGTPLGESVSLSIHESQSRWWETLIGRSLPFCKFFYPLLQEQLPRFRKVSLNHFYRAVNQVKPSFIRVEADEVTYCLHVILRFEIEKRLITGKLSVSDLPDAWNEKMKELFGIVPKTDSEGCLQDIHWSLGDFGYFPTYALGNLFSAQFFSAFHKDHPDWEKRVEAGDFPFIRDWLKDKIHRYGRMHDSDSLVKRATGKPLSETAYCSYLKKKYSEIYRFKS